MQYQVNDQLQAVTLSFAGYWRGVDHRSRVASGFSVHQRRVRHGLLHGEDAIYVWAKRGVSLRPEFKVGAIENK